MKRFIFILGGARSGKSRYAVELAKKFKKRVAFIATATSLDREMKRRIKLHKISRPPHWKLIEEGKDVSAILSKLNAVRNKSPKANVKRKAGISNEVKGKYELALIDCLGLLISNLLADDLKDEAIEKEIKKLIDTILKVNLYTILVSNEAGSGIVPANILGRRFRDLLGLANQMMAKKADEVIFMQSGIPTKISDGGGSAMNCLKLGVAGKNSNLK